MGEKFRIVIRATPRTHPDPTLLAQVVILLGRHLRHQRQQRRQAGSATRHTTTREATKSPRNRGKPIVTHPQPGNQDTPRIPGESDGTETTDEGSS